MPKKVVKMVKLQVPAGKATPAPPVGQVTFFSSTLVSRIKRVIPIPPAFFTPVVSGTAIFSHPCLNT
jgi:hypothetical protein